MPPGCSSRRTRWHVRRPFALLEQHQPAAARCRRRRRVP